MKQAYAEACRSWRLYRRDISQGVTKEKAKQQHVGRNNLIRDKLGLHRGVKVLGAALVADLLIEIERLRKEYGEIA